MSIKQTFKNILRPYHQAFKLAKFQMIFRNENKHNHTTAQNIFPMNKVKIGRGTYGNLNLLFFENPNEKITIGNYCSIANDTRFLAGGGHSYEHLTTYPAKHYCIDTNICEATTKGEIILDDDVWIGHGCIILSGVHIGQGAVIGAGSVVAKDIPPYAIFAGGKILKYRFDNEIIKKLLMFDYSKLSEDKIQENIDLIYGDIKEFLKSDLYKSHIKQ